MLTRYGFTSAFDLGSEWTNTRQIRDRIESGRGAGAADSVDRGGARRTGRGATGPDHQSAWVHDDAEFSGDRRLGERALQSDSPRE